MDERIYLMWLMSVEGMTPARLSAALAHYGTAEGVWERPSELLRLARVGGEVAQRVAEHRNEGYLSKLLGAAEAGGMRFVSMEDADYPDRLKEINDAPPGIYIKGELSPEDSPYVAIVGARKCTEYGMAVSELLARELAAKGIIVVSGMARGVDGAAHRAAIANGGATAAVLGCGLDLCYPPEHRELWEEIPGHGCLISEYAPATPPLRQHFPARNRIISGLTDGIIVIEAGRRSGTGITVDCALDQGRLVFAVPGSILSEMSRGTNTLIREGALPVTEPEDVLAALAAVPRLKGFFSQARDAGEPSAPGKKTNTLARDEKLVYDCINFEPMSIDYLTERTGIPAAALSHLLVNLELGGYIRRLPGQGYMRSV